MTKRKIVQIHATRFTSGDVVYALDDHGDAWTVSWLDEDIVANGIQRKEWQRLPSLPEVRDDA